MATPDVRLIEDPVRMLRAVALAARLDFRIDAPVLASIRTHRHEIAKSSAPRMLEEYYKILRAGSAEKTFRTLAELGLLEPISTELHRGADDPLWQLARRARRLPPPFEDDARHAHERRSCSAACSSRSASRCTRRAPGRSGRTATARRRRQPSDRPSWASCRWPVATSSGFGRC